MKWMSNWTPTPEKTTLKKPSLVRVKLQDLFNNPRKWNKYENLERQWLWNFETSHAFGPRICDCNNWEGALFSWVHVYYVWALYIYIYMYIYIYIYIIVSNNCLYIYKQLFETITLHRKIQSLT